MQVQYERVQLSGNFHYVQQKYKFKTKSACEHGTYIKGVSTVIRRKRKNKQQKTNDVLWKSIFLVLYSGLISLSNVEGHTLAMLSFLSCIVNPPIDVKMS